MNKAIFFLFDYKLVLMSFLKDKGQKWTLCLDLEVVNSDPGIRTEEVDDDLHTPTPEGIQAALTNKAIQTPFILAGHLYPSA